jgi:hypothetical protein
MFCAQLLLLDLHVRELSYEHPRTKPISYCRNHYSRQTLGCCRWLEWHRQNASMQCPRTPNHFVVDIDHTLTPAIYSYLERKRRLLLDFRP